jgi:hypothetical protein
MTGPVETGYLSAWRIERRRAAVLPFLGSALRILARLDDESLDILRSSADPGWTVRNVKDSGLLLEICRRDEHDVLVLSLSDVLIGNGCDVTERHVRFLHQSAAPLVLFATIDTPHALKLLLRLSTVLTFEPALILGNSIRT